MTAALNNNAGGTPFATGVDAFVYPQFLGYAQRAPTTHDIYNPGTRWQDNSVNPAMIYETTGAGVWNQAGGALATTTTPGIVFLATLAQTESGGAPSSAYVSSANDVATALAAIVVGAGNPATTALQGYVYLADATAVVTPYTPLHGPNTVIPVNQITTMFASPPTIGGTAAGIATFTTLNFATLAGSAGGTWNSNGTTINIGSDAASDGINIGTAGSRTIIIGSTGSATNTELLAHTTLTINGTTATNINIGAGLTTGTLRIGGTAQSTGHIQLGNSSTTNIVDIGIGNGVNTTNIATGSGTANAVNIATGNGGNTVAILGGTTANTLNLSNGTGGDTVTIASGINTSLQTVNIANGTGSGGSTVNILSGAETAGTSTLLLGDSPRITEIDLGNANPSANRNIYIGACQTNSPGHTDTVSVLNASSSTAACTFNLLAGATPGSAQTINVMTGVTSAAVAQTVNIMTGAAATGTSVFNLGTGSQPIAINLGGTGAGAKTISIGDGVSGNQITIGNGTNTTSQTISIASGASATQASAVNILDGATPGGNQTLAIMAGIASAGTQSVQILGGANTTGSQNFQLFNGAIAGATDTISMFSGVIASGTCTYNLFNGNASGGTLAVNIFGATAATTAGTVNIGTGAAAHVVSIGNTAAGIVTVASGSAMNIQGAAGATITIGAATQTAKISIANSTGGLAAVDLMNGVAGTAQTLNIASGTSSTAAQTVNILNGTTPGANTTLSIMNGAASAGTQTVNILASGATRAGVVNIATGAAAHTLTLGTTNSAAITVIAAGTGSIKLNSGQITKITTVNHAASAYAALGSDYFLAVDPTAGVVTITLPAAPTTGQTYVIYDATGQSAANTITIDGNGNNISSAGTSAASKTLTTAYASMTLYFNGTIWNGQKVT